MNLRPTTNLVIPENLMVPANQQKTRFFYLYNKGYTGREPVFFSRIWASLMFPSIAKNPKFGDDVQAIRRGMEALSKSSMYAFLKTKKVMDPKDPHFVASIPLFTFSRTSPVNAMSWLNDFMLNYIKLKLKEVPELHPDTQQELQHINDRLNYDMNHDSDQVQEITWSASQVMNACSWLDANGRAAFNECLIGVRLKFVGHLAVIYLEVKITKEEAQQLTTTEWIGVRNMDLYPLLLTWVHAGFGYTMKGSPPLASFSVSRIARDIKKVAIDPSDARVNEEGLAIDNVGRAIYLPRELDQTMLYEDAYNDVGSRDDGSFSLLDLGSAASAAREGKDPKIKLPVNVPVLIDWVNNKYSYTNTNGMLTVLDLVRFRKAEPSHIVTLLNDRGIDLDDIESFIRIGEAVSVSEAQAFSVTEDDYEDPTLLEFNPNLARSFRRVQGLANWFKQSIVAYEACTKQKGIPLGALRTNGFRFMRPIARYLNRVADAVGANLESVYQKFSVYGTAYRYAQLLLISKYADSLPHLKAVANSSNMAALTQGVDPNWEMPSIPLLSQNPDHPIGFLPHQEKIRNLMKDRPDFAIMPVQAGGGKSPLLLTDVLLEIKANESAPYLVMCPGHLVPNYVREVVYFTDGRLNVIPITTYVIKNTGWDRLQAMLEQMPRNTVVVVDYGVLSYQPKEKASYVCYGTAPVNLYPVIDFLRQFRFGYAALDESHKVKNNSARTRAAMELITDIKKKRLASGTMVHDSPTDLATQVGMMDPTLFGSREDFNAVYGERVAGAKVTKWREGYDKMIMNRIKERVVVAGAMRKEWAALLPPAINHFVAVDLTPKQKEVYDIILAKTIEEIEEAAKSNEELRKFLKGETGEGPKTEEEQREADLDEDDGDTVAAALQPYLQRLEAFTSAPGLDKLGKELLSGEDLLSPKVAYAIHRIRLHLEGGTDNEGKNWPAQPGKILIFTNYHNSVEAFWDALPADLKAKAIKYRSSHKVEDNAQFENNDDKRIMIGIEQSMNEGLNFQFATRLIRMEGVWNPGTLEQGNSRINRPELKKNIERNAIFYDWIMGNATIDITKNSRLISKIVTVGKFENADNPAYAAIPELPVVKMSLDSIRLRNTWGHLEEYNAAYMQYQLAQRLEYKEYRENYVEKFGREPELRPIPMETTPKDAKVMLRVPYTPGLQLYNEDELGLVRLDTYMDDRDVLKEVYKALSPDATEAEKREAMVQHLATLMVHTEYGDGRIKSIAFGPRIARIGLTTGYQVRTAISAAFVITRSETSMKDIRNLVLRQLGDIDVTDEIDVPAATLEVDKDAAREQRKVKQVQEKVQEKKGVREVVVKEKVKKEETQTIAELHFVIANGFFGITYFVDDDNPTAQAILQNLGFRATPQFYYAQMKTSKQLRDQFNKWHKKGFTIDPTMVKLHVANAIGGLADALDSGNIKWAASFNLSKKFQLQNFYRMEHKPNAESSIIKPYPMIEDNKAYLVLPARGQAGTKAAIRVPAAGVHWALSEPSLTYFGLNRMEVAKKLKELQENGLQISNIADLRKRFQRIRPAQMKLREDEDSSSNDLKLMSKSRDI